jgi:hydrogenase maturation protein HypF
VNAPPATRLKLAVRGAVQGVGFRPFIFRLASELGLRGWVNNSSQGVFIEVEGPRTGLEQFLLRLENEKPPHSFIQSLEASWRDPVGYAGFEIRASETGGDKTALVLPDIATCPDCLSEVFDPGNRRYHYPFTNCTNCGPRFSIIEALPYDRVNTSMKAFTMCPPCQAEYDDPSNRRFHAQPNACPVCGPQIELWDRSRAGESAGRSCVNPRSHERDYDAVLAAGQAVRDGKIVAIKGLGGFHLLADARSDQAIQLLRERKQREEKPFALMFPTLDAIKTICEVSLLEERLLRSSESPIVLLKKIANRKSQIGNTIAPNNPCLGAMLPYTPLHHLLMTELGFPVVATSGNLSDEPICTDEREALERLGGIADVFLVHNRPIVRHVDDSIVRVLLDRELVLRRARGYAPLPIQLRSAECGVRNADRGDNLKAGQAARPTNIPNFKFRTPNSILAVGAHLKNTVALAVGPQVFLSQHVGDLETEQAHTAFRRVIADFEKLYAAKPHAVAADLHPDYLSTKTAQQLTVERRPPARHESANAADPHAGSETGAPRIVQVQHHIAHVLSCMAENELSPPALGVSWDGTGYGLDGTIWGGEFFLVTDKHVERLTHLRPFPLPGGDQAVKEPRRAALGLLYEMLGDTVFERSELAPVAAFSTAELAALKTMLEKKLNSPVTSSAGRLFDAVASLVNLRQQMRFEGQAAMELEFALDGIETDGAYRLPLVGSVPQCSAGVPPALQLPVLDWRPMIEAILSDVKASIAIGEISAKFHNALVEAMIAVAKQAGEPRVVLSGGCFQNSYLTRRVVTRLREEKFQPYWHQRVPPNDGGIALGQVVAALRNKS